MYVVVVVVVLTCSIINLIGGDNYSCFPHTVTTTSQKIE